MLENLYSILVENRILIATIISCVFAIVEFCILVYIYKERKNYLIVSKRLIVAGLVGIVYITLMIILINYADILAPLYILFVSLIIGAIRLYYAENKRIRKRKNFEIILKDSLKNVNNKSFEYWARLDKNQNCIFDFYITFEKIDFIYKDFRKTLLDIDLDEKTIDSLLIVDSHVDAINRDLPELRKLLKEYDGTRLSGNTDKLLDKLNMRKMAVYRWSCRLAIYSEVLISNNLKINEDDENYKVFDNIIKARSFNEITKIVTESVKFKEKGEYFCNFISDSGKTSKEKNSVLNSNNYPKNGENEDDEKYDLKREKLLLELMKFNYVNEDKRNSDLDNKSSSLIAFLGVMLTIQATVGAGIIDSLKDIDYIGYVIKLFIISLIFYGLSILLFILAYNLKKFKSAPVADQLYDYGCKNASKEKIVIEVTGNLRNSINHNEKILNDKARYMKAGFINLLLGMLFTIIFISVLLSIII